LKNSLSYCYIASSHQIFQKFQNIIYLCWNVIYFEKFDGNLQYLKQMIKIVYPFSQDINLSVSPCIIKVLQLILLISLDVLNINIPANCDITPIIVRIKRKKKVLNDTLDNFILEFMHKKCEFTQHRSASLRILFDV
jgi:hypothetical protein